MTLATALRRDLIYLVREHGVTVFLSTHNMTEAEQLCPLIAALGTVVSLKARGVRQAQQMLSGVLIFPVLVVWLVFTALCDRLPAPPPSLNGNLVVLILAAVLVCLSVTFILFALRWLRRGRLLLD